MYTKTFDKLAFITKARVQLMRDIGAYPDAMNAFILNIGLETLPLRMERHSSNALEVAKFLQAQQQVESVNYPGLSSSNQNALAQKYLPLGTSGVISFVVKGGKENAIKFMDNLKLAYIEVHVADICTSVLHPASSTHRQMTNEQLENAGISAGLIRLSVGLENVKDIINDLDNAFKSL